MQQVLKRLLGANKENVGENDKRILNDGSLQLLKESCGVGVNKQKQKRGPKVTPGKKVKFLVLYFLFDIKRQEVVKPPGFRFK